MKFVIVTLLIIGAYCLEKENAASLSSVTASLKTDTGLQTVLAKFQGRSAVSVQIHSQKTDEAKGYVLSYDPIWYSDSVYYWNYWDDYYWYPYYYLYPWYSYYVYWRKEKLPEAEKVVPAPTGARFGDVNQELKTLKKEVFGNESASTDETRKKEHAAYSTEWLLKQLKLTRIIDLENQINNYKKTKTDKKF